MLQQTPVSRVLAVWQEWIERWPSPADLAAEPAGEAIRAWGRLGYPRRAMRLHECAIAIVERHGGDVPDELDKLLALPGIGDYTARAVLSFAFGQRHPVVDTNVRRLVARVRHGVEDRAIGLAEVADLLPPERSEAALASAAMMEVGALVCTARSPAMRCVPTGRRVQMEAARLAAAGASLSGGRKATPEPTARCADCYSPCFVSRRRRCRGIGSIWYGPIRLSGSGPFRAFWTTDWSKPNLVTCSCYRTRPWLSSVLGMFARRAFLAAAAPALLAGCAPSTWQAGATKASESIHPRLR